MINQKTSKKFDWQYISNEHKNDKLLCYHLLRGKMRVTKNFEDEVTTRGA